MAENKTRETDSSVQAFIDQVENPTRRQDAKALVQLLAKVSGKEPKMWGQSIVGFGSYHYRYDSGREGDAPLIGFSPRKANLVLYLFPGASALEEDLRSRLGKHRVSVSCLYINKLADVDVEALEEVVAGSWAAALQKFAESE